VFGLRKQFRLGRFLSVNLAKRGATVSGSQQKLIQSTTLPTLRGCAPCLEGGTGPKGPCYQFSTACFGSGLMETLKFCSG
jgi:hypothetical protein